jgi:hypothetical protein
MLRNFDRQYGKVKWEDPDLMAEDIGIVGLEGSQDSHCFVFNVAR